MIHGNKNINSFISLLFIASLCLWLGWFIRGKVIPDETVMTTVIPISSNATLSMIDPGLFNKKVIQSNTAYATIDVTYPEFKNASSEFNQSIVRPLLLMIEQHKKTAEEDWKARKELALTGENMSATPSEKEKYPFYASYEIIQANQNYISMLVRAGGFQGGAHGFETIMTYNYDVHNQKEISYPSLITNYNFTKMRDSIRATLNEKFNNDEEANQDAKSFMDNAIQEGTQKEDDFKSFTFTKDEITFYFQQYQVGPYVIGEPEVTFPRK